MMDGLKFYTHGAHLIAEWRGPVIPVGTHIPHGDDGTTYEVVEIRSKGERVVAKVEPHFSPEAEAEIDRTVDLLMGFLEDDDVIEVAMVFDDKGRVIHWHEPRGAHGGAIPDSRDLWDVLWEHRDRLGGVAHTHPWKGDPWPSKTDTTTWRACEKGLGKLLLWPVVTFDQVGYWVFNEVTGEYTPVNPEYLTITLEGIDEIRRKSGYVEEGP